MNWHIAKKHKVFYQQQVFIRKQIYLFLNAEPVTGIKAQKALQLFAILNRDNCSTELWFKINVGLQNQRAATVRLISTLYKVNRNAFWLCLVYRYFVSFIIIIIVVVIIILVVVLTNLIYMFCEH